MFGSRKAKGPVYQIIRKSNGKVLEEVAGARRANNAQKKWAKSWLYSHGPYTTVRLKPTGLPKIEDTLDALILEHIPAADRKAYVQALRLTIISRVPLEDLAWLASGGRAG